MRGMQPLFLSRLVFLMMVTWISFGSMALASVNRLLPNVAEELLSESDPTAFAPNSLGIEDFILEWIDHPIEGVEPSLGEKSFQWVRTQEILILPRARIGVRVKGYDSGRISNNGFTEDFVFQNGEGVVEMPIPLISGPKNFIQLDLKKGTKLHQGKLQVRFKPRPQFVEKGTRVFLDPSCSSYKVRAESFNTWGDDWVYVGCRMVRVEGKHHRTSSLEAFVYWDNVGKAIKVGGIETESASASVWPLRLRPEPQQITLEAAGHGFTLHYFIPEHLHNGNFSLGVGPYWLTFKGNNEPMNSHPSGLVTLYGSYFLTELFRLVAFGAIALESHFYTDMGLYLNFEQFRFLDRRIGIKLLVGGHGIGFRTGDQYYGVLAFPQGIEAIFTDAFLRGNNLTLGAFVYPLIAGNSYYNVWLRWGNQVFWELNYIAWETQINSNPFSSASAGVSVGFPLARFW